MNSGIISPTELTRSENKLDNDVHTPRVSAQLVAQLAVHGAAGHPRADLEAHGPLSGEQRAVPRPLRRPLPHQGPDSIVKLK